MLQVIIANLEGGREGIPWSPFEGVHTSCTPGINKVLVLKKIPRIQLGFELGTE